MNFKQEYSSKLKDPRWQKKRLEVFDRDKFTCQKCGSTTNTQHVHHMFYESGKEPWDYNIKSLITLCESCHAEEEEAKGNQKAIVQSFLLGGFFNTELDLMASLLQGAISTLGTELFHDLMCDIAIRNEISEQIYSAIAAIPKKEPTTENPE